MTKKLKRQPPTPSDKDEINVTLNKPQMTLC